MMYSWGPCTQLGWVTFVVAVLGALVHDLLQIILNPPSQLDSFGVFFCVHWLAQGGRG
jgi:hypothetical protein